MQDNDNEPLGRLLADLAGARMAHRTILACLIAGLRTADIIDEEAVRQTFGVAEALLARGGNAAAITEAAAIERAVTALLGPSPPPP